MLEESILLVISSFLLVVIDKHLRLYTYCPSHFRLRLELDIYISEDHIRPPKVNPIEEILKVVAFIRDALSSYLVSWT